MSDNLFAKPPESGNQGFSGEASVSVPQSAPGALTTILIFCLILGIFGLLSCCMSGLYLGFSSALEDLVAAGPGAIEQKEFQRINMDAQKGVIIPMVILAVVNLVVATMLIVGSVGALRGKESGRNLLRTALLFAMVYGFLKIVVALYSHFAILSHLAEAVANYQGEADPEALQTMVQIGKIRGIIGTVMNVLFSFAILCLYAWSRGDLNKERIVRYFASQSQRKPVSES